MQRDIYVVSRVKGLFRTLRLPLLAAAGIFALWISPLAAQTTASTQPEIPILKRGEALDREISGKKADSYEIALRAGEYAGLAVEQRGIDVVAAVSDPSGKQLAEFDSEARIHGEEHVVLVAESAGNYLVSVRPRYSRAAAGHYQIELVDLRPAQDKEKQLFQLHQLTTQAQKLSELAKYPEALQAAAQAFDIGEKQLASNDPYLGEVVARFADLERVTENRPKSEELFKRAIAIDDATLGHENPQTAVAVGRLGSLYNWADDYLRAEPLLQDAFAITEKTLGPEHPRLIGCLSDLSVLYSNRHENERAVQALLRAQAIAEKAIEPDEFQSILILNNLGNMYRLMNDYERAEPMIERVVELIEKKYGPDYPRLATPLTNLAIFARKKKQYTRSLELLWRAEAVQEKAYGSQTSGVARVLITIGNTYRAEGEYQKALETYQRARDILKATAGPYDVLMLLTYVNAATAYAAMGDMPHAVEEQTRVESIVEDSIKLNLAIGSEREKLDYLTDASERTERTISLNVSQAPQDTAATNLATLALLQRKGRVLDAMSGSMATLRERLNPQDQALLDELNKTTTQLAKLALNGAGKTPAEEYQKQLTALEDQREKLEAQISSVSAEFRLRAQTVTLAAVQSAIPPQSALVEFATYRPFDPKNAEEDFAFGDPHYIAYVLSEHGDVRWKELGPAKAIDEAIATFRKALRDPESKDVQAAARTLDEMIMQPVRELTGNATQLLISPDGQLNLIPFEALLDEHGQYLLERYSITYLSTGRDLLRMGTSRPSKRGPVVVADPFFGEPSTTEIASASPAKTGNTTRRDARRSATTAGDLSSVYFAPLDGTAVEARAIKALFPDSKVLMGRQATQAALMKVDAPSILHIATHGFFLTNSNPAPGTEHSQNSRSAEASLNVENPLLRSGLALAGANLRHQGAEKGILTALEASNLNLWGTKLVTLSACDTGVGDVRDGEGVYGLRRAFVLAGAESVVMSLWPVSDYVTREMMSSYYTGLKKGLGRGEALRQTKLAMLKRKGQRHPFYWASFIQSGEWANLDGQREVQGQDQDRAQNKDRARSD
jgi:CHAT domain-containing protein